jgi:zinc transport system permease protein
MLEFDLMRRALLVGIMLAITIPCIGVIIVLRRLSMTGDALSHVSLAGVAMGVIFGLNPIFVAVIASVLASFAIEFIRKKFPKYAEISIAIIMSTGIGLAGILSGFAKGANFNSFLFGSIVAINDIEFYTIIVIFVIVTSIFALLYKELMYISFNERSAVLSKVPTKIVNTIFTFLTALTVSIASRTIGALLVSSLMVIPVACAMLFATNYKQTVIYAILFSVAFTVLGITASYYIDLKPGGTIVIIGVIVLLLSLLFKMIVRKVINKNAYK